MSRPKRFIVETDGAARGNPGLAGAGVIIRGEDGHEVDRVGKFLGRATNNQAEYEALIAGLEAVKRFEPEAVTVRMDSELVVRQMTGEYRVKAPDLIPLYSKAIELAVDLPHITFVHVPRGQNAAADRLANVVIDSRGRRVATE